MLSNANMPSAAVLQIKQRFGIIGNSPLINREIEKALLVAPTDMTVLITGENGVGKEVFPQIIHQNSVRKHGTYIAVNCGAIPTGTISSELFGHEKGAFTSAVNERKGYFEAANKGTIFLDEIGELPWDVQTSLLRILEYKEFTRVGSSTVQKTDVRIIAATNVDLLKAIRMGKFREDLYYRLNTISIIIPPLRDRKEDIYLLFRKFASDFAERNKRPNAVHLTEEAQLALIKYRWHGNIRELKNVAESISLFATENEISAAELKEKLINPDVDYLPALMPSGFDPGTFNNEKEILYQLIFELKREVNELKKLIPGLIKNPIPNSPESPQVTIHPVVTNFPGEEKEEEPVQYADEVSEEKEPETLSLRKNEKELIIKALERNKGKRRNAAMDLGMSERTLYRKIKEYNLE
jgi:DNA-binding NtrC family response regulator